MRSSLNVFRLGFKASSLAASNGWNASSPRLRTKARWGRIAMPALKPASFTRRSWARCLRPEFVQTCLNLHGFRKARSAGSLQPTRKIFCLQTLPTRRKLDMKDHQDRKAIVVGGASGMGKATAAKVLEGGGSAVLVGRTPDKLSQAAQDLGASGRVITIQADVSKPESLAALQERIDRYHADA